MTKKPRKKNGVKDMQTIKIDDREYNLDDLSQEAKDQLVSLNFVDSELSRLGAEIAVYQTARNAYASALSKLLPKD